jgi:hypothetical protein
MASLVSSRQPDPDYPDYFQGLRWEPPANEPSMSEVISTHPLLVGYRKKNPFQLFADAQTIIVHTLDQAAAQTDAPPRHGRSDWWLLLGRQTRKSSQGQLAAMVVG